MRHPEAGGDTSIGHEVAIRLLRNVEQVVVGKQMETALVMAALLSGGHVLLEDVPGTAKTILARVIAQSIEGATFARLQGTPDLQPTDITGLSIFNQRTREFEFRAGPVFANVVLVDEVNRAMPRTQSALLEAMAERQVTVDGVTRALPSPFLVIATENPIDQEGTFPLPEAQLDRFAVRTALGYPLERIARAQHSGARNDFIGTMGNELGPDEMVALVKRFDAEEPGYFVEWQRIRNAERAAREFEGRRGAA